MPKIKLTEEAQAQFDRKIDVEKRKHGNALAAAARQATDAHLESMVGNKAGIAIVRAHAKAVAAALREANAG